MVALSQEFQELSDKIRSEQQAELNQLKQELAQTKGLLTRTRQKYEPLDDILELFKQVDAWQEKTLDIKITDKATAKNVIAFAKRYGFEPELLVTTLLNQLFMSQSGQSTLGLIVGKLLGRENRDT